MGKRERDCVGCGAPVGIIGREHCCRCTQRRREAAAKAACPGWGRPRVVQAATRPSIPCARRGGG
ncbi:hypothetical protein, partial [Actinoplanes sp. NPDC051411]|uniref:hypothetical protein n=1 Tax=Actinoplanes sp. NPDC051411 TaxID=3155522 RepID=UPI00343CDE13